MGEREPQAGRVETNGLLLRAVRSLTWNRLMLPLIQARLERAERIVRSQLFLVGEEHLQVGPYGVTLNQNGEIELTWQANNDWQQLHLPEPASFPEDPLDLAGKPQP